MSDFHYVRTLGSDGGVDACSGPAIGLDLESVLQDGLPPYKVALQIIAGLCEILDIAEEDDEVHGDIEPKHIFIDDTGAVSLEAFGQQRTRAPEGRPKGVLTDLYGLGYVAFRLLAFAPMPKLPLDDPNAHDDAVIDAILSIRFDGLNEDMVGDVQWFLAKLLSFEREERPSAVETWRTFLAFAEEARGPDFVEWCLDALDSGGERRTLDDNELSQTQPGRPPPPSEATDGLKGPMVTQGPLAAGGIAFGGGPAAANGTAFFTKDEMKAALEKDHPVEQFRPALGGGSATNYWNRDQLAAMANDEDQAPRPKRAAGEGEKRKTMAMSKGDLDKASQGGARPRTAGVSRSAVALAQRPPVAPPPPKPGPSQQLSSSFGTSQGFDQPEPTVRMNAKAVRTLTPAPAPQVFRPPGNREPQTAEAPLQPPAPAPAPTPEPVGRAYDQDTSEATVVQSAQEIELAMAQERARVHASLAPTDGPLFSPAPEEQPAPYEAEGGMNVWIIGGILLIMVIAMIACAGLGGISAFVALASGTSGGTTAVVAPAPTPKLPLEEPNLASKGASGTDGDAGTPGDTTKPSPSVKPTTPKPTPTPTNRPQPTTPRPSPGPRPSPTPTPSPGPRPQPQPTPAPAPAPAPAPVPAPEDGPVTLSLRTADRGKLSCPGVGTKAFDGNTTMEFENYALPATCLVIMDEAKESFQVFGTGMIKCNKRGDEISCSTRTVGR